MENTRRKFLKNSGLLAGAVALGPLRSYGFNSSVDDTIKIALIGCGGRGTGAAAQALSTKHNVKLVAMADVSETNLNKSLQSLQLKKYFNEKKEPIDVATKIDVPEGKKFVGFDGYIKAIAEADVVLLTAPPGFRPSHFEEAVKQEKQIFAEKPVATDAPGIRRVLAAAEEAKKKKLNVVVGLQRHYQANYVEALKRIHDGDLGEIVGGQVYWVGTSPWVRLREPNQTEMQYQVNNWYYFNWLCGDHIVEQHVHNIDVANWVKGSHPVKIQGTGGRQVRKDKKYGEIFDHHILDMIYEDGTVISSQCRQFEGAWNRVDEAFVGTKGRIDSFDQNKALFKNYKGKTIWEYKGDSFVDPYQEEHNQLFEAVAKGDFKFSDGENGAKSTMTGIMGRMATYSGQMIEWEAALNSQINLFPDNLSWEATPKVMPNPDGTYPIAEPGKTIAI